LPPSTDFSMELAFTLPKRYAMERCTSCTVLSSHASLATQHGARCSPPTPP
jgi:hypothetical protein